MEPMLTNLPYLPTFLQDLRNELDQRNITVEVTPTDTLGREDYMENYPRLNVKKIFKELTNYNNYCFSEQYVLYLLNIKNKSITLMSRSTKMKSKCILKTY